MNVSAFDLNHARALHFLLEEAHVARAARRLGITPAAASNALRRLRQDFDDELLVRVGRTLARTALGEQLRGPAREVLAAAERLLGVSASFEPGTYEGEFVLTTSDRVAEALLPALDDLLTRRAPRASLSVRTVTTDVSTFLRDEGGLAIVADTARERGLSTETLFLEDFVCALREGHPLLKGAWTARRFAAAEHILVAPRAQSRRGSVDDLLEAQGLTRRITRVVTSFALATPLLVSSDRITVLPRSFAQARARELGIVLRAPPFEMPSIQMELMWHPGHERDPKHLWFRGLLRDAVRAAGLTPPRVP
ncbi:LysR family transcriptional regulator [Pyxidicoccus fallax]|uniref:LysR family transcriptional regulator n=1 Tax=Pyxidicoccus fallax TaxID=394095 RepID=A0A848LJN8_9BACT|nr:LysR family transcriptional regulator [Pyxidicoccus fallax]NMO17922.1 LysR family transcriptional regulator [Pyxidicoccus fallax]NPC79758.1 LysR family transcriptional regulator [Pyxidicoccus fallax]